MCAYRGLSQRRGSPQPTVPKFVSTSKPAALRAIAAHISNAISPLFSSTRNSESAGLHARFSPLRRCNARGAL